MKSSLLSNCHMVGLLDQSTAGDSRLVVNVVGRHIPMPSFSIFSVISKWCMEARLCSALILTVSNSRLFLCLRLFTSQNQVCSKFFKILCSSPFSLAAPSRKVTVLLILWRSKSAALPVRYAFSRRIFNVCLAGTAYCTAYIAWRNRRRYDLKISWLLGTMRTVSAWKLLQH